MFLLQAVDDGNSRCLTVSTPRSDGSYVGIADE